MHKTKTNPAMIPRSTKITNSEVTANNPTTVRENSAPVFRRKRTDTIVANPAPEAKANQRIYRREQ